MQGMDDLTYVSPSHGGTSLIPEPAWDPDEDPDEPWDGSASSGSQGNVVFTPSGEGGVESGGNVSGSGAGGNVASRRGLLRPLLNGGAGGPMNAGTLNTPSKNKPGTNKFALKEGTLLDKQIRTAEGLALSKRDFLNKAEGSSARDRLDASERDRRADEWDADRDNSSSESSSSSDDDGDDSSEEEGDDEEKELLPASWVILLLDAADEPVIGAPLAMDPLAPTEHTVFTDFEGKARFDNITPEQAWSLYHLDPVDGAKLLGTHQFESEEEFYNTYRLDSGGDEKGSITMRIQSSEGQEIREGWIASTTFMSEEEIPTLQEGGAFIQAIQPGQSITFTEVNPHEEVSLYFISGKFESLFLTSVTLKSGEEKNLGTLRLQNDALLSSYLSGVIQDKEFNPKVGLTLELRSGLQTPLTATTDESGFFSFDGLNRFQRYTMIGRDSQGYSEILIDDLLIDELEVSVTLAWVGRQTVSFSVKSNGNPVDGAHLTLSPIAMETEEITPPRILDKITNDQGEISVDGIYPLHNYELSLSHPFYQPMTIPEWTLGDRNSVELNMEPLVGVKVKVTGPNIQLGLVVRAWIGVERDGFIVPDYQPGNEYDQEITEDELLFATPPQERFWVYMGGLPEPWGSGLHGPFTPGKDEFIQIDLQEVEPLWVDISQSPTPEGSVSTWNTLVYALAGGTEAFTQIKGQQLTQGTMNTRPMFLHPGDYRLRIQSDWHEKVIEDITLDGSRRVESYSLTPRPSPTATDGWATSFLISDTFPLILSGHNPHHEEMSYGFNIDFLSHLGGERRYSARHLGEHSSLDGKRSIVWRQHDVPTDQWYLNLKDYSLFPEDAGDYVTSYVQFQVESASTRPALLALNSDDGFKAWVNGELVGQINIGRPIYKGNRSIKGDQDLLPIRLNAGRNQLNFKVVNSFGFYIFAARILEPDTLEPLSDITYFPEPLVKSKPQ